jgi:hypothetical protein
VSRLQKELNITRETLKEKCHCYKKQIESLSQINQDLESKYLT